MGFAALNIYGYTMNSLLDIPLEINGGTEPWDTDKLQTFKQKYNIDRISAIITNEISIVKLGC